jgi:hypothetical protein
MQAIGIHIDPSYQEQSLFTGPDGDFWKRNFDIAELSLFQCGSLEDTTCVPYDMFVTGNSRNVMGYSSAVADTIYTNALAAGNLEDKRYYVIQHQARISQDLPVLPLFKKIPGFIISGTTGVAGATLSYFDGMNRTVTANASGVYSLTVSPGWSGIVTPSRSGYRFHPALRSYGNVLADQITQDYTADRYLFLPLVRR